MRRRLVGAAVAVGLVVSGGTAASGGEVTYGGTLDATPNPAEPGEVVTISNDPGSECHGELVSGNFTVRPGEWSTAPGEDGSWTVRIQIPPNGAPNPSGEPTPFPPGEYEILAHCYAECPVGRSAECGGEAEATQSGPVFARSPGGATPPEDFNYEPEIVTVVTERPTSPGGGTESPPTSDPATPTTDGATPTTAAPDDGAVAPADAARATTAQPTFTG